MTAIKKYAALVVTSGDTVLREGALLGAPTIYTSDRIMDVNKDLYKEGLFAIAKNSKALLSQGKKYLSPTFNRKKQEQKAIKHIATRDNMTQVIVDEITTWQQKKK